MQKFYITECPRDAMQGIKEFIPTDKKIQYLQSLLAVGFDCLDFGSFVSPKAIPQLSDTKTVVEELDLSDSNTELLAIIANKRGAIEACELEKINSIGFPLSVNETFQQRNTNKSIAEALTQLSEIGHIAEINETKLVVYLSMAFGNPYDDPHSNLDVHQLITKLQDIRIERLMLSDTIGNSSPASIDKLFRSTYQEYGDKYALGLHLHSSKELAKDKIIASINSGCRIFDGALLGIGGCPMAKNELVGNLQTEMLVESVHESKLSNNFSLEKFSEAEMNAKNFFQT